MPAGFRQRANATGRQIDSHDLRPVHAPASMVKCDRSSVGGPRQSTDTDVLLTAVQDARARSVSLRNHELCFLVLGTDVRDTRTVRGPNRILLFEPSIDRFPTG